MADGHVLGADARATENIAGVARNIERRTAVVPLGERYLRGMQLTLVLDTAESERYQLRGRDATRHVRHADLDRLRIRDRLAEQYAVLGVAQHLVETGLGCADDAPADAVARLRQAAQRPLQRGYARQYVFLRHSHVVEEQGAGHRCAQRELVFDFLGLVAGHTLFDDEALDAFVGLRPHDGRVGDGRIRDPHLCAVEHPVVAVSLCMGLHVARVRAAVRLGQPEAADGLAAGHGRQPAVLLLVRAVGVDRVHDEARLHRHEAAQSRVAALQLLADQAVADAVHARAVIALDRRAQQPQFGDFADEMLWKLVLLEGFAHHGNDAIIDEPRHGVPYHGFVV